jgi:hypothetical protein
MIRFLALGDDDFILEQKQVTLFSTLCAGVASPQDHVILTTERSQTS